MLEVSAKRTTSAAKVPELAFGTVLHSFCEIGYAAHGNVTALESSFHFRLHILFHTVHGHGRLELAIR